MGFYTDWILAPEADADAVASIVAEERHLEDWPHVSLRNIGQIDLQALWAILREEPQELRPTSGELLYQESDDGPFVCRVQPAFVQALADVNQDTRPSIAAAWRETEGLSERPQEEIETAVHELCAISRQALDTETPILELTVI